MKVKVSKCEMVKARPQDCELLAKIFILSASSVRLVMMSILRQSDTNQDRVNSFSSYCSWHVNAFILQRKTSSLARTTEEIRAVRLMSVLIRLHDGVCTYPGSLSIALVQYPVPMRTSCTHLFHCVGVCVALGTLHWVICTIGYSVLSSCVLCSVF